MEEKILLLMEETGCDQGEARLALELANYDFEKAIKTIKSILKGIIVIKGKFISEIKNMFGLFIIIFNQRKEDVIRTTGVVSYNPVIYEQSLSSDWHLLEKSIYSYRLLEGSVLDIMKNAEEHFYKRIIDNKENFIRGLQEKNEQLISSVLFTDFFIEMTKNQINIEEINLEDYHRVQPAEEDVEVSNPQLKPDVGRLTLEVEIVEDTNGKRAHAISQGEVIFAHITDDREVAKYLSKLLGARETPFIPVPVEEIEEDGSDLKLRLYFTPGIAGLARVKKNSKLKIAEEQGKSFIRRIFGLR
ncbi:MAG: hypothetical protein AB1633_03300 [Elusimicrobiota bacterium]